MTRVQRQLRRHADEWRAEFLAEPSRPAGQDLIPAGGISGI